MADWYMSGADPSQPLASLVFADLAGLPPLFCVVGGDEILLDDSIRLVRNAGIAGIDATLFIAAGMQHEFPIWAGSSLKPTPRSHWSENGFARSDISVFGVEPAVPAASFGK